MAVPKKKVSRSRRDKRRFAGGNKIEKPTASTCSECFKPIRRNSICSCGFLGKTPVLFGTIIENKA